MQTHDTDNIHRFLDYDEDTSIVNQFFRMLQQDQEKARDFLKTHSKLSDEQIDRVVESIDNEDDEAIGILLSKEAEFRRTTEEVIEAYNQAWDRVWYGRSQNSEPVALPGITELEMVFDDIQDEKYYDPWGWGYLSGVLATLNWVLGESWRMLDT